MSDDKIQFESEITLDLSKANSQLQTFQKRFKNQQIEVGVKFDENSANAVDRLAISIGALRKSGQGLDQFNRDMIALRKNLSSFSAIPAFSKTAQSLTNLSHAFMDLKNTSNASRGMNDTLKSLSANLVQLGNQTKNIHELGKAMSGLGTGLNAITRATQNIDKIENALGRLQKVLSQLKSSGTMDVMNSLPGNFSMNAKGQTRMTPVRIVAPSMDEYTTMKNRWEAEMARRPIRARIAPEMDRTGLQRFQNLLIALSFGQFEANLRRISGQLINNYSQIENAQTTLRTVYRDSPQQADRAYKFLSDYEQKTPFSFEEVIRGGTQFAVQESELKKVGFDLERVMRMSGEMAAAFNGDVSEIQTGISRVLSGDQNGLEILDKYGISRGMLKQQGVVMGPQGLKLSGPGDVKAVLDAMESFIMSKTGGNLAERRGETTSGIISNMQSQFFKTQAALFEPVKDAFAQGAKFLTMVFKKIGELPEPIRMMIGGATLATSAFLMVAQQASSLGLVLLGMNNAGLFNGLKKGALAGQAVGAGGSLMGSAAGGAVGGVVGKSVVEKLFPTFLGAAGSILGGAAGASGATGSGLMGLMTLEVAPVFAAVGAGLGGLATVLATLLGPLLLVVGAFAGLAALLDHLKILDIFPDNPKTKPIPETADEKRTAAEATQLYNERYTASSDSAMRRREQQRKDRDLGRMAGEDLIKNDVKDLDITQALARVKSEREELLAIRAKRQKELPGIPFVDKSKVETLTGPEKDRMKELDKTEEEILANRRQYRELTNTVNVLMEQTAERARRRQLAELRRDLGPRNENFTTNDVWLKRPTSPLVEMMNVSKEQEEVSKKDYLAKKKIYDKAVNDPNVTAPALKGLLNQLLDAEATLYKDTLQRIADEKAWQADQREFIKNNADLRMGTGGTERENSSYMRAQANLMPANTPDEIRAKEAALNAASVNDYKIEQARKQQRIDNVRAGGGNKRQQLQGGELAAQLAEVTQQTKKLYEATGYAAEDRIRIERDAAIKIKKIYFDHYQGLLKLAQDNMQAMHKLETDRLALLQAVLQKDKALRQAALSRESIEKQYDSQGKINKIDKDIEQNIVNDTGLKLKQAKEKYTLDMQKLEAERAQMKATASPQALKSKDREIALRKSDYGLEKESIKRKGGQELEEFKQEKKFRKEDLDIEATTQILEDENNRLNLEKENLQAQMGQSKRSYVDLIKEELNIERALLINANQKAKANDKKLTTQQKKNLDVQLQTDLNKADVAAATKIADSGIAGFKGQAAGLDEVIAADKTPGAKLVNMKKKLELEKKALYLGYLKDAAQPGADKAQLQTKYMQDLTDLQQKYLDQAKSVTAEFEAQNKALMERYQNKNGFTMGEVFGIDQLAENMSTDSEYSKMKYDQINVGPKPYSGMPGKTYPGYGGNDPFSKDRFDMKDRLRTQQADAMNLPMTANIPGTMKDLQKVDVKGEFVLKVITPDGKTTNFSRAINPDVPPKGKGAQ